jgi:cellulose biosynthesis protein BcsQ
MKIAVMSPSRDQGITTASILLGLTLAQTQGLSVCLTHSGLDNSSLEAYLGISKYNDKTKSITQIIRLLESHAIAGDEIADYCTKIENKFEILNTAAPNIDKEESAKLLKFIIPNLKHDIVITDVETELWEETTKQIIQTADVIIIVMSQNIHTINKLEAWRESEYYNCIRGKPTMYIINKFDGYVSAFRDFTKQARLKHMQCCKISYSPFIKKTANMGKLHTIIPYILERDVRVCELNNDLKECMQVIKAHMGERSNWR